MPMRTRPLRLGRLTSTAFALATTLASGCASSSEPPALLPISAEETRQLFVFSHVYSNGYDGHGFVLEREGKRPLGITAFHVAGPITNEPSDPDAQVTTALLHTIVDSSIMVRLGARFVIADAHTLSSTDTQRDVAAFAVRDFIPSRALQLAAAPPAVGDTVYVLALHVGNDPRSGPRRHPARVVASRDLELRYIYLASANSNFTSGAAVLDRDGHVVGLNVGTLVNGPQVHGLAVTLHSLRALLPD
jgi:hypothetical protein